VFFAFFVTLLMVPALYAIGVDITEFRAQVKQRVKGRFKGRKAEKSTVTP